MTLKSTVGRKERPLPVNWQDSAWDLEVRIEGEPHRLSGLHRLHELPELHGESGGMRNAERGMRNGGYFRFWRCGSRGSNRRGRRLEHARARVLPIFETLRGGIMKNNSGRGHRQNAECGMGDILGFGGVAAAGATGEGGGWNTRDRKSTRLNSSHIPLSRMPSSA